MLNFIVVKEVWDNQKKKEVGEVRITIVILS